MQWPNSPCLEADEKVADTGKDAIEVVPVGCGLSAAGARPQFESKKATAFSAADIDTL